MNKTKYPKLQEVMRKCGDTQYTLAKLLGYPQSSISRRFSGEIEWGIGEIEIICDYYKKDYIFVSENNLFIYAIYCIKIRINFMSDIVFNIIFRKVIFNF